MRTRSQTLPLAVAWTLLTAAPLVGADDPPLADKTLVVWAAPAGLDQRGGSALTIDENGPDRFDAIVLGELRPRVWMAGSNNFARTAKDQSGWPEEAAGPDELVAVAIAYRGTRVSIHRDGELVATYTFEGQPHAFGPGAVILIGPRHLHNREDRFVGRIRDARVYDRALSVEEIRKLRPGAPLEGVEPWAWWDFARTGTYERTGRFNVVALSGDARIDDGGLVLGEKEPAALLASRRRTGSAPTAGTPGPWTKDGPVPAAAIESARLLREKLLDDPYRPRYHFCVPEGDGRPGDANGCFWAGGRYHLMYLYNRNGVGFSWGHVSSHDLVHWRHHPDAIGPGGGDEGCFSGGAFVDDDGTAYLSYWMLWGARGIGLARSRDRHYERWEKLEANPVIRSTEWGITETTAPDGTRLVYGSADPTNVWKKGGRYYILTGNLLVLNKYGRKPDAPEAMRGDHLYLLESSDLESWTYRGEFYSRRPEWTDASEDNMCPSFLPLPSRPEGGAPSGKHLLLFISHNKGCQYYVGTYDTRRDRFLPETHGRMTWVDNTYFAPEALVDGRGRQIMWAWLTDNPGGEEARGWSGVFGLPRSLWVGPDGTLRMRPVRELEALRTGERGWSDIRLAAGETKELAGVVGDACELAIRIEPLGRETRCGVRVRASPGGEEETLLYYDHGARRLSFDARRSGRDGRRALESAPFALAPDEPLDLRVFVDRSVVEVYANDRQAICRRVYPGRADSRRVRLHAEGGPARFLRVRAWEMMPSNAW